MWRRRKGEKRGGCEYCRDPANRAYHLDLLGARAGSSDLLVRCPRCSSLWELPSHGRDDTLLSLGEARARYPEIPLGDG